MSDINIKTENSAEQAPGKLTVNYVLEQIERISKDTEYLYNTIQKLGEMANESGLDDIVGQAKAQALGDVVKCRETTNQQLLKMYEKMYDDLKPQPTLKEKALEVIERTLNNPTRTDNDIEALEDLLFTLQNLNDEQQNINHTQAIDEIIDCAKSLKKEDFDSDVWNTINQALQIRLTENN